MALVNDVFYDDPGVSFLSIHQDGITGNIDDIGRENGVGATLYCHYLYILGSLVLGFPNISLVPVSGQSGTLVGQESTVIVVADADCLPQVCCGSALSACVLKRPGRSQLIFWA
nr:hypothetical protein [Tanacetum cinerariifolium]